MAPIRGRPAARGTWHVPPREGLQKVVDAPTGRTEGTADPKKAGHTYTTPTCVLLWLPFLCDRVCLYVCMYVCPSISGNSARTAGPIGTGVAPMNAPKRRNDNGAGRGSAGGTCLVARAAAWKLAKKFARTYRSNGVNRRSQTRRSHVYHPNLKFDVTVV